MRITSGMIQNQVVFNMQRSIARFMATQMDMSSGRRINRPSDDPAGTMRDLDYRTQLAKIAQYKENVDVAQSRMATYDANMADMKNFVSQANEIAIAMANGNYDATARSASAAEISSIFDQMIQLGNVEHSGQRVYGGYAIGDVPFEVTSNGVIYTGDQGDIQFEVESSLRMGVNFTGDAVLLEPTTILGSDMDMNVGLYGDTLLQDLNAGNGLDLTNGTFTITDENLGVTATIDLTAAPAMTATSTVNDLIARINADLAANVPPITDVTAAVGVAGNNIDLITTASGLISGLTSVGRLNDGEGIDLIPGQISVTDGGAISETVDFSGANTVQDLIDTFNAHFVAAGLPDITMGLNAAGTGLEINDATLPAPLGLTITESGVDNSTAANLGILGSVGAQLAGADLNPQVSFTVTEGGGTTGGDLGLLGSFSTDFEGTDLNPRLDVSSSIDMLRNGNGIDRSEIVLWQGAGNVNIDFSDATIVTIQDMLDAFNNSGLNITASINADGTGIQVVNNEPTMSFTIEEFSDGRTAKELGIYGSSDIMGSLLVLRNALENDDQEGTGLLLEHLDDGIEHLLEFRGTVGSRALRLETTANRLMDQEYVFSSLLAQVEDADLTEVATQLATQEAAYQAALMAGARIIQPSLMDFLR